MKRWRSVSSRRMKPADREFLARVYSTPIETYIARLRAIGFEGLGRVLDAGCGFGQWTTALARLNGRVVAVDRDADRVQWLRERVGETANVHVIASRLEDFAPVERFDGIFCYGVLHYTAWEDTLRRFHRWLVRGGRLYVTFNGIGWYVHLWENSPNKTTGYDPQMHAAKAFRNTLRYRQEGKTDGSDVIITTGEIRTFLKGLGMKVETGSEGTIDATDIEGVKPKPFFQGEYWGLPGVREVLAVK